MRFISQEHKTNTCFFYGSRQTCNAGSVLKQAFTLLELLVVIAIIAIFTAILLPTLSKAKQKALLMQCLNNNKQFGLAWTMYAVDNNDSLVNNYGSSTFVMGS